MATSVRNRQFPHLEPSFNGGVRNCNFPSSISEFVNPKKPVTMADDDDFSSDEDNESDFSDLIRKGMSELEPSILDARDLGTVDAWIQRNASMIRLTGKHPFNSEAPLALKGPLGHIEYVGRGNFVVDGKRKHAKKLAMLAGGTGITPIYQVAQAILKDSEDETEMFLVYANRTEDDILLREEMDEWVKSDKRFKVWYVVKESVREGWEFSVGVVTESIMREHLPKASVDTLALACGPPPMIKFAVQPNLEKMNYDTESSLLIF
ncbi:nitrate reductase [NADH]-like [Momordica charantia]|uniref:Nitrate reductase [NADH]-like n=1 Tax=Momordica charantia TaxID=3673 RepID=A0A6J1C1V3_MOMCH|nr:nitrate reductase [NADH]-like [Momordica charantia]